MAPLPSDEDRCTAKAKATRERCKRPRSKPLKVCAKHGGAAPRAKSMREDYKTEQKARAAFARMDYKPVADPLTALRTLAGEIVAWKDFLFGKVEELQGYYRYQSEQGTEQLRSELTLYERALDRAVSVLGVIAKLNIDERLAAIEERQAQMLEEALFAAFEEAGLGIRDADAKERVARSFAAQLSIVA